ncbi:DUF2325 domain-containing protein [Aneurinibacillus danicus]|uniref:DUF2325 domain-containing protein n=1 Tax=Aneurinibacillus danicus TaxID=267746 RepID=A0A511VCG8_9BACL|nr:DUF2325 domain-containing protein [Aneurinibacillus danicus]GEN36607.1 hypothetical protein ADA01nite_40670 [Aneurinibacillus danicus]
MKTVLVIGGHTKQAFERKAKERGIRILFHSAHNKRKDGKKMFEPLVRKSDCVIIMLNACSHHSMWDVKSLSKEHSKPVIYQKGLGATQALERAYDLLKIEKKAM